MSKRPALTGRKVITALEKAGFENVRTRGSHHRLQHPDGRSTTVPVHGSETIGRGLLSKILRDCGLSAEEFNALL